MDVNKVLTLKDVQDNLDKLRGAIMIVYPMSLPPYDPVQEELDMNEDLSGTQVRGEVRLCKVKYQWRMAFIITVHGLS